MASIIFSKEKMRLIMKGGFKGGFYCFGRNAEEGENTQPLSFSVGTKSGFYSRAAII